MSSQDQDHFPSCIVLLLVGSVVISTGVVGDLVSARFSTSSLALNDNFSFDSSPISPPLLLSKLIFPMLSLSPPELEGRDNPPYLRLQPEIVSDRIDDASQENIDRLVRIGQDFVAGKREAIARFLEKSQ